MANPKIIFDRFFKNKEGRVVLFQAPNVPIVIWVLSIVLNRIIKDQDISRYLGYIGFGALIFWAGLEIVYGASYFRRTLGLVILLVAIISRIK